MKNETKTSPVAHRDVALDNHDLEHWEHTQTPSIKISIFHSKIAFRIISF